MLWRDKKSDYLQNILIGLNTLFRIVVEIVLSAQELILSYRYKTIFQGKQKKYKMLGKYEVRNAPLHLWLPEMDS